MSGTAIMTDSGNSPRLSTATNTPFAQQSWFDEAWSAARQFAKGEYDGPAAMLLDVVLGMVPVVGQAIDARDIILGLNDVSDRPGHHDAWFGLITALIGVVPGGGDAVKRALRSIKKGGAPASELHSMLRGLGRGNTEQIVLDMLDVTKLQPYIKTLTETLKNNRLVAALDAGTRQRVIATANRLQTGLNEQSGKFSDEVRGWLKKQPNNSAEADYVSKKAPRKAEKPNAKGGTAAEAKEHSTIGRTGRENFYQAATSELAQSRLFFKSVLGEHMADYWVLEQGWAADWQSHDWGMDGKWANAAPRAPRKLNDRGAMTPLWPVALRGRGIDALWRTNGKNGKSYAVIEAKAYTNPATPLSKMFEDRHDKQEYENYRQKVREWKGTRDGRRSRSGKRGKATQQPSQASSSPPPHKPERRTMQMSYPWIDQRLRSALSGDLPALADLRTKRQGQRAYTRHVLLFSVPNIFDHAIAVWKWLRHSQGQGEAPADSEHASHAATRIFGDIEIDTEERRRNVARPLGTRPTK